MFKKIFTKSFLGLLSIIFILITFDSIITLDSSAKTLNSNNLIKYPLLFLTVLSLFVLLWILMDVTKRLNPKYYKYVYIGLSFVVISIQLFILFQFNINQVTDAYMIKNEAINIANGASIINPNSEYFAIYSNNDFSVLMLAFTFKILKIFGVNIEANMLLGLIDIVFIDIAIATFTYATYLVKGRRFSICYFAINVLNPFTYILVYWSYTLVYSLPIQATILMLFAIMWKKHLKNRTYIILGSLIGILTIAGYFTRPTVVITTIGLFMFGLFHIKDLNVKKHLSSLAIIGLISITCFAGTKAILNHYSPASDKSLPMTHWIMMGIHDNGIINMDDLEYSLSYKYTDKIKEANIKRIKKHLAEYNVVSFTKHCIDKTYYTWSNGAGSSTVYLKINNNNAPLYQWLIGYKSDFMSLYCQAFRILMYLLMLYSLFLMIFKENTIGSCWISAIIVLGGVIFYMIWEAKSVYCIPFLPYVYYLSTYGIMKTDPEELVLKVFRVKYLSIICIIGSILAGTLCYNEFTNKDFNYYDNVIMTESNGWDLYQNTINDVSKTGGTISQNFYTDKEFSIIGIHCEAIKESNRKLYTLRLFDESDTLISIKEISSNDIDGTRLYHGMLPKKPNGRQLYTLTISANEIGEKDTIKWYYQKGYDSSQFNGKSTYNGEEINDLNINVFNPVTAKYFGKITYICVLIFWILCEIIKYIYLRRYR